MLLRRRAALTSVVAVAASTLLVSCASSEPLEAVTGAAARDAWPADIALPDARALAWYHRDGNEPIFGVALEGVDAATPVIQAIDASKVDEAHQVGGTIDLTYEGSMAMAWEWCEGADLVQIYRFPQESTFVDGVDLPAGVTQVYFTLRAVACD